MIEIINSLKGDNSDNDNILDIISKNKNEWTTAFKKFHTLSNTDILSILVNNDLEGGAQKKRDVLTGKSINEYTVVNILNFLESDKGKYYQGKKKDANPTYRI